MQKEQSKPRKGAIFLHREIRNHWVWDHALGLKVWLNCLLEAQHNGYVIDRDNQPYELFPGDFIFGRFTWASQLRISPSGLHKWIKKFKNHDMLRDRSVVRGASSIYTIVNWEKWQRFTLKRQVERQVERQGEGQDRDRRVYRTVDTNNNVNKENKVNKEIELSEFISSFNSERKTSYKPNPSLLPNFEYWRNTYSMEELKNAVSNLNSWWAKDASPTLVLRRKNPKGEEVDYIGELLNIKSKKPKRHVDSLDKLFEDEGGDYE